jgi:hypothetical protein
MTLRVRLLAVASLLSLAATAQAAPSTGGWDWAIAPYGWGASVGTDLTTNVPPSTSSNDVKFEDLVDHFDGVGEVHVEGQGDSFGFFADFTYLGLADESDQPNFRATADLDTRLFEAAAVYSPGTERFTGVETFAGLRVIDMDFNTTLTPRDPAYPPVIIDTGDTLTDFMLGVRYTFAFGPKWGLTLRGDGSWGDTEGTWNASAIAQYHTAHGAWAFGYRYLDVDLKPNDNRVSISMSGPIIGYAFKF